MNAPSLFYTINNISQDTDTTTVFCTITLITLLGSPTVNPLVYCLRMPLMKKHVLLLVRCGAAVVDEEDARLRADTRTESVSMDRNMSVVVDTRNKDTMKLLEMKNQGSPNVDA